MDHEKKPLVAGNHTNVSRLSQSGSILAGTLVNGVAGFFPPWDQSEHSLGVALFTRLPSTSQKQITKERLKSL
jgi:hypothetical protein